MKRDSCGRLVGMWALPWSPKCVQVMLRRMLPQHNRRPLLLVLAGHACAHSPEPSPADGQAARFLRLGIISMGYTVSLFRLLFIDDSRGDGSRSQHGSHAGEGYCC